MRKVTFSAAVVLLYLAMSSAVAQAWTTPKQQVAAKEQRFRSHGGWSPYGASTFGWLSLPPRDAMSLCLQVANHPIEHGRGSGGTWTIQATRPLNAQVYAGMAVLVKFQEEVPVAAISGSKRAWYDANCPRLTSGGSSYYVVERAQTAFAPFVERGEGDSRARTTLWGPDWPIHAFGSSKSYRLWVTLTRKGRPAGNSPSVPPSAGTGSGGGSGGGGTAPEQPEGPASQGGGALQSNVGIQWTLAAGAWAQYTIDVTDGAEVLNASLSGEGDADLYVRYQGPPSSEAYDEASRTTGTASETIQVNQYSHVPVRGGTWHIGVHARTACTYVLQVYAGYAGLFGGEAGAPDLPATTLLDGQLFTGTLAAGASACYAIEVLKAPIGLSVQLGGTGEANLALRQWRQPRPGYAQITSSAPGCSDVIRLGPETNPIVRPGVWFIWVTAQVFTRYTITASVTQTTPGTFVSGAPGSGFHYAEGSVTKGQWAHFHIGVGAYMSVIEMEGDGDGDLYVSNSGLPTLDYFTARPYLKGSREVLLLAPHAGSDFEGCVDISGPQGDTDRSSPYFLLSNRERRTVVTDAYVSVYGVEDCSFRLRMTDLTYLAEHLASPHAGTRYLPGSGSPLNNVPLERGAWFHFLVYAHPFMDEFSASATGTNDTDLYLARGGRPNWFAWDSRAASGGSAEQVTWRAVTSPDALQGVWVASVYANEACRFTPTFGLYDRNKATIPTGTWHVGYYQRAASVEAGLKVTVSLFNPLVGTAIHHHFDVVDQGQGTWQYWTLDVPENIVEMKAFDVYVRRDGQPTLTEFDLPGYDDPIYSFPYSLHGGGR